MQAVLLAAGESSRFWPLSDGRHKSLFSLMGKPLIQWTLESLVDTGIEDVIVVHGPSNGVRPSLEKLSMGLNIQYVQQESPKGMGDALLQAVSYLDDSFVVLHAHQFMADSWIDLMLEKKAEGADLVLAGQETEEPWKYGILEVQGGKVVGIVEKPKPQDAPSNIRAIGIYLLNKEFLEALTSTGEEHYSFEEALHGFSRRNNVHFVMQDCEPVSLKYPWDLLNATRLMMNKELNPHVAPTAEVSPLAYIDGNVWIGDGAKIYEYAVIKGPCYIGPRAVVGTYAIVRDHTDLEEGVVIGAHSEAARSIFQAGSSTHSGFFGDSIFDQNAKIGAGTITANVKLHRDQVKPVVKNQRVPSALRSLGVVVGRDTQLGVSAMTMPGVLIGARSFIGPGVVVDENVSSDTRIMLKQEKVIKENRLPK